MSREISILFSAILPIEIQAVESDGVACLTDQIATMSTVSTGAGNKSYHGLEEDSNSSPAHTISNRTNDDTVMDS